MSDVVADPAPSHGELYDPIGGKIGMWLFLFTEILLFGTLFLAFGVYLHEYTWQFRQGSDLLDIPIGTVNTVILLTSSLTMALSIAALQRATSEIDRPNKRAGDHDVSGSSRGNVPAHLLIRIAVALAP